MTSLTRLGCIIIGGDFMDTCVAAVIFVQMLEKRKHNRMPTSENM